MEKWRNLPGIDTAAFTLFCHDVHGLKEGFLSFCVTFVMESCSCVCLLVVPRLLGLTLRHFAPVCCCHRVSWARGRLAFAQEAVHASLPRAQETQWQQQTGAEGRSVRQKKDGTRGSGVTLARH